MADPLSIAAGIIAILQAGGVVSQGQSCRIDAHCTEFLGLHAMLHRSTQLLIAYERLLRLIEEQASNK